MLPLKAPHAPPGSVTNGASLDLLACRRWPCRVNRQCREAGPLIQCGTCAMWAGLYDFALGSVKRHSTTVCLRTLRVHLVRPAVLTHRLLYLLRMPRKRLVIRTPGGLYDHRFRPLHPINYPLRTSRKRLIIRTLGGLYDCRFRALPIVSRSS